MLGMDRIYVIRHKWHQEGLSIRQIARDLEVSRNTVRKYVGDAEEPRPRRRPEAAAASYGCKSASPGSSFVFACPPITRCRR